MIRVGSIRSKRKGEAGQLLLQVYQTRIQKILGCSRCDWLQLGLAVATSLDVHQLVRPKTVTSQSELTLLPRGRTDTDPSVCRIPRAATLSSRAAGVLRHVICHVGY